MLICNNNSISKITEINVSSVLHKSSTSDALHVALIKEN